MKGVNPEYLKRHGIEAPKTTRSKYGAKRTEWNGKVYDSALEANCAAHLQILSNLGYVTRVEEQVRFDLGAGITYVADFVVHYTTGQPRTIDAKGMETQVFKLKRKLFEEKYGPLDIIKNWGDLPREGR